MKKRNRALSMVLAFAFMLSIFSINIFAEDLYECETVTGQINSVGVKITKYNGSQTNISIPETINGSKVLEIGDNVFKDNITLSSVTIPEYVEKIGKSSFEGCFSLKTVTMNSLSLFSLGENSFKNCTSLTSFTLPLLNTPVTIYSIIGKSAFWNCQSLETLTINAKKIDDCYTFNYDYCPFYDAGAKTDGMTVVFGDEVTNVPANIFWNPLEHYARVKNVTIGKNVEIIGNSAFENCIDITDITMNSTVLKNIGESAFNNCTSLTSFTIPKVTNAVDVNSTIGKNAFRNCQSLETLTINAKKIDDCYRYDDGYCPFYDAGAKTDGMTVVFGDEVTNVPANIFWNPAEHYARVKSVTIGKNVAEIGSSAFENCLDLTDVTMNSAVLKNIGDSAFNNCMSLTSFTIPKIENAADVNSTIGKNAFRNCQALETLTINAKKIDDCYRYDDAYCPFYDAGAKTDGMTVVFGDEVTYVPANIFACSEEHYARVKSVTIGKNVAEIGSSAFENCKDLDSIKFYSANCEIYDDENIIPSQAVIYGYADSTAQGYAIKYGRTFRLLSDSNQKTLTSVTVLYSPSKTVYTVGDTLDISGLTLTATYSDNSTATVISGYDCSPTTLNSIGTQEITVTYENKTTSFNVTVNSTTEKPVETTTAKPVETTTAKPAETTTAKPAETTTAKPAETTTAKPENDELEVKADSNITINIEMNIIIFNAGISGAMLENNIVNDIRIVNSNDIQLSASSLLGTGCKVQNLSSYGSVLSEYEVSVLADVSGDGKITASDAREALRASATLVKLDGVYKKAADISGDGKITASDARQILRMSANL